MEIIWALILCVVVFIITAFIYVGHKVGLLKAIANLMGAIFLMGPVILLGVLAMWFRIVPKEDVRKAADDARSSGNIKTAELFEKLLLRYKKD